MEKVRHFLRLDRIPQPFRKFVIIILGGIFFLAGIVMIITPGPAFIFIPFGLLLLASEFKWAERWAQKILHVLHVARQKWHEWRRHRRRRAAAKS
jgi:hypothetical protein